MNSPPNLSLIASTNGLVHGSCCGPFGVFWEKRSRSRVRFGRDNRFTAAFDLNFLNLFDQDVVTGVYPTLNPSSAPVNAAAIAGGSQIAYVNGYTDGSLLNAILARISSQADRSDVRYKLPQVYQSPRVTRFGFRFLF